MDRKAELRKAIENTDRKALLGLLAHGEVALYKSKAYVRGPGDSLRQVNSVRGPTSEEQEILTEFARHTARTGPIDDQGRRTLDRYQQFALNLGCYEILLAEGKGYLHQGYGCLSLFDTITNLDDEFVSLIDAYEEALSSMLWTPTQETSNRFNAARDALAFLLAGMADTAVIHKGKGYKYGQGGVEVIRHVHHTGA